MPRKSANQANTTPKGMRLSLQRKKLCLLMWKITRPPLAQALPVNEQPRWAKCHNRAVHRLRTRYAQCGGICDHASRGTVAASKLQVWADRQTQCSFRGP